MIGGAVITEGETLYEQLAFIQNAVGAVPGPMDCFLALRGAKTLSLRMERHAKNGMKIAEFLAQHPKVSKIFYPFHPSHPHYSVAKAQMRNGGGIVSFVMKDGAVAAKEVAEATKVFTLAESLGGVESLIEIPAAMTHMSVADSPLAIDPGLIRLSVGIEHVDDLLEDLEQALESG
jgi:cystathionine beta-lyase/cystathionine gamma-synthase